MLCSKHFLNKCCILTSYMEALTSWDLILCLLWHWADVGSLIDTAAYCLWLTELTPRITRRPDGTLSRELEPLPKGTTSSGSPCPLHSLACAGWARAESPSGKEGNALPSSCPPPVLTLSLLVSHSYLFSALILDIASSGRLSAAAHTKSGPWLYIPSSLCASFIAAKAVRH